jgi:hypothetical protein
LVFGTNFTYTENKTSEKFISDIESTNIIISDSAFNYRTFTYKTPTDIANPLFNDNTAREKLFTLPKDVHMLNKNIFKNTNYKIYKITT